MTTHEKLTAIRRRLVAAARAKDLAEYNRLADEHRAVLHAADPAKRERWENRVALSDLKDQH